MPSECNFEFPRSEVPKLNGSIVASGAEESVIGRDTQAPNPSLMSSDNPVEFVRCMPLRFDEFPNIGCLYRSQLRSFS